MAALLTPNATFASLGGPVCLADRKLEAAVRAASSEFLADDSVPSPDGTPADSPMQWPGTELERSPQFVDVRQLTIERRPSMPARDYVVYLSTVSAYLALDRADREKVLDRIQDVLPNCVTVIADPTLHLARTP